jgi:hypothetical protein
MLDHVALLWRDALRRQAVSQSKLDPPRGGRSGQRPRAASNGTAKDTAVRPNFDPEIEAFKKVIATSQPDLDADGIVQLVDEFTALRDREEFRQEKKMQD